MKKSDHIAMRNESLFCLNCGGKQVLPMPLAIPMFSAMAEAFTKMHEDCEKTWKQPEVDQSLSVIQKLQWWLANGERGMSSDAMYARISKLGTRKHNVLTNHPIDPDDFRRCYLLLKTIPEWRGEMDKMRVVSDVWDKLVGNWDKLTEMLEEQMKTKTDNGMYKFMKELGC